MKILKSLIIMPFLLLSLNALASWDEARAQVEAATVEMQDLLATAAPANDAEYEAFQQRVAAIISPVVDFPRISRGVMAKHYRNATAEQKARFAEVFEGTLIKTYAKTLAAFKFEKYEVLTNRQESTRPDRQIVQIDVFDDRGRRFHMVYYLVKGAEGWKVTNVQLDGINLRQVFKTQFSEAVNSHQGNLDGVINDWKELVADTAEGRPPKAQGDGSDAGDDSDTDTDA